MKKTVKVIFALAMALLVTLSLAVSAVAEETAKTYIAPDAIVDLTTQKGFDAWQALAKEFDEKALVNGEYSKHGMDGKVDASFVSENGESFARFVPKAPLENVASADAATNDFRTTAELNIPITGTHQYLAFCYRVSKGAHMSTNNIYFRDMEKGSEYPGEFNGNSGYWTPASLKVTGEWEVKVLDLKSVAKVKDMLYSIRVPIAGGVGETFDVKWYVLFNETDTFDKKSAQTAAKEFDIDLYHTNNPEPTEVPPTEAPATEAPTTEIPVPAEKSGCGSVIGFAGVITLMAAACVVSKKH